MVCPAVGYGVWGPDEAVAGFKDQPFSVRRVDTNDVGTSDSVSVDLADVLQVRWQVGV